MKCAICKKRTTWDESYDRSNFIVCPKCIEYLAASVKTLRENANDNEDEFADLNIAVGMIFAIGTIKGLED